MTTKPKLPNRMDRIADAWDEEPFVPCMICPRVDDCHMMGECQDFAREGECEEDDDEQ